MNSNHELVDLMKSITNRIDENYSLIQKKAKEDPGTAGDQGEEKWAELLRNWLPGDYTVVTKGRLINEMGESGPQVDVIVLKPFYPKELINFKLYLTTGVIAAFECKITLKKEHIVKVIENSKTISNLLGIKEGNFINELHSPIIYGLLSHSHSWKRDNSNPLGNIDKAIEYSDLSVIKHPREMLDLLCVSDLATWSSYKMPMSHSLKTEGSRKYIDWVDGVQTSYGLATKTRFGNEKNESITAIGDFFARLYKKISYFDNRISDLSKYFNSTLSSGAGFHWRNWDNRLLSSKALYDLKTNPHYKGKYFWDVV